MPRDSSGLYTQPPDTAAIAHQTASSSAFNLLTGDLGDEISNSLSRDGLGAMRAALGMAGFKINNLLDGTADTDAATVGQVRHATTAQFGIVNDGVTDDTDAFNDMIAYLDANDILSVKLPAGPGMLINGPTTPLVWSNSDEKRFHFYGDGIGVSKIIHNSTSPCFFFDATTQNGDLFAYFHDFSFQTTVPNAGCPIRLWRRNVPTPTKFSQAIIEHIACRVFTPTDRVAYWGDFVIDLQGWFDVIVRDIFKEDARNRFTTLASPASAPDTSLTVTSAQGMRKGWTVSLTLDDTSTFTETITSVSGTTVNLAGAVGAAASAGNHVSADATDGHDTSTIYLGMGGVRIWNCYGIICESLNSTGGYFGVLHGHDFTEAPEGGNFFNPHMASDIIGYRSATHDNQPGLFIGGYSGYGTPRDNNVLLGGPVTCGTATGGSTTTVVLGEDPPSKTTTLKTGSPTSGASITITSTTNLTADFVGCFIDITLDNASIHHTYIDTINTGTGGITLHNAIPGGTPAANGNAVVISILGNGDIVRTVAGPPPANSWGQKGVVSAYDRSTLTLTFSTFNDSIAAEAGTRYIIESVNISGGRKNVYITNFTSTMAKDQTRVDTRHGITNPTDFDLTTANGAAILGGSIHFGGGTWLDDNRRGIAFGNATAGTDLLINGVTFDGNGQYCVYNAVDDMPLVWQPVSISGAWTLPVSNGNILRMKGGGTYSPNGIWTLGRPPASLTDGTDKTADNTKTYIATVKVEELTKVTGIGFVTGSAVAGKVLMLIYPDNDPTTISPIAFTDDNDNVSASTATLDKHDLTAPVVLVPGLYAIALQLSNNACKFRTHAFGTGFTNIKSGTTFGDETTTLAGFPNAFGADEGPIAVLY